MACVCGLVHTITISDDGVAHAFGRNNRGQLGLGHNIDVVCIPTPIANLPQIKQVSCGWYFTVCVDVEGFIWSFGENSWGQLGTGNTTSYNIPQKILNIPPARSVACGSHTLIITNDDNLWSCGFNKYGQLCLENAAERQSTFQKTSFSNIIRVSAGIYHSLFQNISGEIYSCGRNGNGLLGLGHFNDQITPSLIPNLPSNIVRFVCGYYHNLFLDSEGNVFSVGENFSGQLGLGHNSDQNVLNQIPNIPPIQTISCIGSSSFLIDIEGNIWSFGNNEKGLLVHGDTKSRNIPTKIEGLKDIQQVSYGFCGFHFLAKDSQNKIFVGGYNYFGQLGTGDIPVSTGENSNILTNPKEMDPNYFTIWGEFQESRAKSARK